MEIKAVRGMHDQLGEDLARWKAVEAQVREILECFGYREIRTPVLEAVEVFSQSLGEATDVVEKQMYQVQDRGHPDSGKVDTLVLRPEATSSVVRAILEHGLHRQPGPQRYYYCLPMFRYERPQKGRLRQFHQIGAELILDATPEADVEMIVVLDTIYRALGITQYEIRINSVGSEICRPAYREKLKAYFQPHLAALCEQCQKRFERAPMRILDCKNPSCLALAEKAPRMVDNLDAESAAHYTQVKKRLRDAGVAFVEDPGIVRGLDYYSRTAFEFTSPLLGAQSALGGGGRYDELSTRFGADAFPAVGWALGMERLMMALEASGRLPVLAKPVSFFFIPLGEPAFEFMYPLSLELKRKGLRVEMPYERDKKLKWLLKQADRFDARYALLLGDDELKAGSATLKDMVQGTQETISIGNLEAELTGRAAKGVQK